MSQTKTFARGWLNILRILWMVVVILTIGLVVYHLPILFSASSYVCSPDNSCYLPNMFTPNEIASLPNQGRTILFILVASEFAVYLTWIGVGLLIFFRKSDELVGLAGSLFLITFYSALALGSVEQTASFQLMLQSIVIGVGMNSISFFLYVFPDGRFVPRWSRWPALLIFLLALYLIAAGYQLGTTGQAIPDSFGILYFALFGLGIILQIYRYFRVSTPIQRQQTKWVVVAIGMVPFCDLFIRSMLFPKFFPMMMVPGMTHILWNLVTIPLFRTIPFLMIPISIGLAILRYRLWDIDIIIRRTLVYSLLTGLLGAVYFGGVALLQGVLTADSRLPTTVRSQPSAVVIVITTLAIAALANPLRRLLQTTIDRRFYRQKYDAEKALADFAITTRSQTDLSQISTHLTGMVNETLQPEQVSLWLRSGEISSKGVHS